MLNSNNNQVKNRGTPLLKTQEITFKQFKIAGEYKYLHPLNTKYDDIPLNHKYRIIGKVIETVRKH